MTQCNCYCMHCIGYLRAKHLERAKCLEGCRDLMQEFSLYVFHSGDDGIHTHGTGHSMPRHSLSSLPIYHIVFWELHTHTHTKCRDLV